MSTSCIFLLFLVISFPFAFIGYLSAFFDGSALLQRFRLPPPRNPGPRSTSSQPLGWAHWEHRPRRKRTCLPWPMASHGIPWHPMASRHTVTVMPSDAWLHDINAIHRCFHELPWTSMNFHELPWTSMNTKTELVLQQQTNCKILQSKRCKLTKRSPSPRVARNSTAVSSDFDDGEKVVRSASTRRAHCDTWCLH